MPATTPRGGDEVRAWSLIVSQAHATSGQLNHGRTVRRDSLAAWRCRVSVPDPQSLGKKRLAAKPTACEIGGAANRPSFYEPADSEATRKVADRERNRKAITLADEAFNLTAKSSSRSATGLAPLFLIVALWISHDESTSKRLPSTGAAASRARGRHHRLTEPTRNQPRQARHESRPKGDPATLAARTPSALADACALVTDVP